MKVTIEMVDAADGTASTTVTFDPPVDNNTQMTPAIKLALSIIEHVGTIAKKVDQAAKEVCSMCGKEIGLVNGFWMHVDGRQPRHPASPASLRPSRASALKTNS